MTNTQELQGRWQSVMMDNYGTPPLALVSGQGAEVTDEDLFQVLNPGGRRGGRGGRGGYGGGRGGQRGGYGGGRGGQGGRGGYRGDRGDRGPRY